MWSSYLYLLAWISTASGLVGCRPCTDSVQIISQNATLLPTTNIVASSELDPPNSPPFSADLLINYGRRENDVWCSTEEDSNPNIVITFTEPVVITGLLTGGYTDLFNDTIIGYVDNFTIEYAPSEDGDFVPYHIIGEDSQTQSFITVSMTNTFMALEEPIEALRLRFSVNGFNVVNSDANAACLTVAIFGCLSSEESTSTSPVYEPVPTTMIQLSSTPLVVEPSSSPSVVEPSSTPSGSDTEPISSKETVVEKDFMVLAIVLPIALVTILIVFVIVAVGVCICVKNKEEWRPRERERSDTLKILDNSELYLSSRERTDTIRHTANTLYQSSADQTYEMIGKGIDDGDGMEMNPTYNDPLIYQQNGETGNHTTEYAYPNVNISAEGAGPGRNNAGVQTKPNESYNAAVANDTEVTEYAYPTVNVSVVGAGTGNSSANVYEETPH